MIIRSLVLVLAALSSNLVFGELMLNAEKGPPQCCDKINIIRKGKCTDGAQINLHCDLGVFILNPTSENDYDNFTVDGNNKLRLLGDGDDKAFEPTDYCLSQMIDKANTKSDVALVCATDDEDLDHDYYKFVISGIACIISVICILATLGTYILVPELRDLQGKCLMATISCLAIAFSFLSFLQLGINMSERSCAYNAYLLYFWFMATFFWLNVDCIQVFKTIVYPFILGTEKQWFVIYNIYGWGAPITFTIVTLIADNVDGDHIRPNIGHSKCWFHGVEASWAYFYGPIAILLICNIILFIITSWKLWKNMENSSDAKIRSHRYKFLLYLKLFLVMGITWSFELISFICGDNGKFFWMITDFINALQGFIIFLLLVVFRKRALRGLAKKGLCCGKMPKTWATMVEEDCEELDADEEALSQINAPTSQQPHTQPQADA